MIENTIRVVSPRYCLEINPQQHCLRLKLGKFMYLIQDEYVNCVDFQMH